MGAAFQLVTEHVEQTLARKNPAPFSKKLRSEDGLAFGIYGLDAVVPHGIPLGAITEMVGPESSGRTTAALALVSRFMHLGNVCTWVDVADAFDPETAAANGVDLERLLWVRCGSSPGTESGPAVEARTNKMAHPAEAAQPVRHTGGGSPHPRSESRNMPQAVEAMLKAHGGMYDKHTRRERKVIGTPGMPNRPLSKSSMEREEQVNSDRLPARRGHNLILAPRCAEPMPRRVAHIPSTDRLAFTTAPAARNRRQKPWNALDQALRATDLLLQSGGFGLIVLDLGSTAAEFSWRIPLATWFRYRAACERSRTSLLLLTQHPCARSSAGLVVRLQSGQMQADGKVMTGIEYQALMERSRFQQEQARVVSIRKPPQAERPGQWSSKASWAGTR